jgi:hypothetical protein
MAAGISHDLVNILNPVSLHAQLPRRVLMRGSAGIPAAQEGVEEIGRVVKRGLETLAGLRDFSRRRR